MLLAYYYSSLLPYKFDALLPPATVCHRPTKQASNRAAYEEWRSMTFISDRAYDDRTVCEKSGEKSHRQCIAANFDES